MSRESSLFNYNTVSDGKNLPTCRSISLSFSVAMQIPANKKKFLLEKSVQLPLGLFFTLDLLGSIIGEVSKM